MLPRWKINCFWAMWGINYKTVARLPSKKHFVCLPKTLNQQWKWKIHCWKLRNVERETFQWLKWISAENSFSFTILNQNLFIIKLIRWGKSNLSYRPNSIRFSSFLLNIIYLFFTINRIKFHRCNTMEILNKRNY